MKIVHLVRGVPGSGKTTLGKEIIKGTNGELHSADDFFTDANGEYHYDRFKLPEAHKQCQDRCMSAMQRGVSPLVIANVFYKRYFLEPYYRLADIYGYTVVEICVKSEFKNIHGCPQDKIEFFKRNFEY